MARIRTIKPDHGTNKKVGKLSDRAYRIWVSGLISQADDEGRLVVDIEEIRARVYAYWPKIKESDVEKAIFEIETAKLLHIKDENGKLYGQLHDWTEHQAISHPKRSNLPLISDFRNIPETSRGVQWEGRKEGNEGRKEGSGKKTDIAPSALKDLWNQTMKGTSIALVKELSKTRAEKCNLRLSERPLTEWQTIFSRMAKTPFLNGKNARGWRASFDWVLANPDNAVKVLEGNYSSTNQMDETSKIDARAARRAKNLSECCGSTIWVDDDGKATCVSCHEPQTWFQAVPA